MTTQKRQDHQSNRWAWILPLSGLILALILVGALVVVVVHNFSKLVGGPMSPPPPLTIIGHNCGQVYEGVGTGLDYGHAYDPEQGELCLWRAYTTCQASTLVAHFIGVDASNAHAVTVQPHAGHCAVTDT